MQWRDDTTLFIARSGKSRECSGRPFRARVGPSAMSAQCPVCPGEFNRSVQHQLQSIGRSFEGQGLSRALIEPQSNGIEVGLGEAREIGSSREVLSQQAVGVLVAATLPWTARITQVNLHIGSNREAFVARHLLALVPRQGAS